MHTPRSIAAVAPGLGRWQGHPAAPTVPWDVGDVCSWGGGTPSSKPFPPLLFHGRNLKGSKSVKHRHFPANPANPAGIHPTHQCPRVGPCFQHPLTRGKQKSLPQAPALVLGAIQSFWGCPIPGTHKSCFQGKVKPAWENRSALPKPPPAFALAQSFPQTPIFVGPKLLCPFPFWPRSSAGTRSWGFTHESLSWAGFWCSHPIPAPLWDGGEGWDGAGGRPPVLPSVPPPLLPLSFFVPLSRAVTKPIFPAARLSLHH